MISGKNIFITGGAGFIGSTLASTLVKHNKIVVYDILKRDSITETDLFQNENFTFIKGDILDLVALKSAAKNSQMIIHAAGIAGIDTVIKNPIETMKVNIIGTSNVLEAANSSGNIEKLINFSTSEVFGSMAFKSSETDATIVGSAGEARWTYAMSKLAGEHLTNAYFHSHRLPTVTIRPFNIYGPKQKGEGAIKEFITRALRNEDLVIHGDGNQIRAWCYVDDFVEGLLKCLESDNAVGQSFNIGNPRAVITILGLASTIIRVLKSDSKIIFTKPLSADIDIRIPSIQKAHEALGFEAKVDLDEGILRTAQYYISQLVK
jgi:UDP-glucose 4-epimerase